MPLATTTTVESSGPLADFFWIAGVDGKEIEDAYWKLRNDYMSKRETNAGTAVSDTIEEDAELEDDNNDNNNNNSSNSGTAGTNNRNSYNRTSRLSNDARMSIRSADSSRAAGMNSNRSSMTIRATPGANEPSETHLGDFDFDKALLKFASERESFLSDLSLTAGAITPNVKTPKPRPRVSKIVSDDKPISSNPLKSGIGSVRRHMSFRDMNSVRRQPSIARQCK